MDTSKQYIKMCDCGEIQERWKEREGDIVYDKNASRIYMLHHVNDRHKYGDYVWLPGQDQLQGMMNAEKYAKETATWRPAALVRSFYLWMKDNCRLIYVSNFDSMEQLWLAFVMSELHSKRWTEEGWE